MTAPAAPTPRIGEGETVAVTGSSGHLGCAVVDDLLAEGYRVVALDRAAPEPAQAVRLARHHRWTDTSVETMAGLLEGCSALIHLAAYPTPMDRPAELVFGNNTLATFVALEAAGTVGIRRAVIASSGSAYGTAWSPEPTHPRYVPIDEDHPMDNAEPYGLSKEVDERTAATMVRRFGMSVAALRFHWIAHRDQQLAAIERQRGPRDWADELRNLWGYVDLRDAARACRLAIERAAVQPYGFAAVNIVAADALSEVPITELVAAHAPDIEVRAALGPQQGAYAIERAREVLGWTPQHSWRDPA